MYWEGKDLVHRPRDKMRGGNGVIDETVLLNPELAMPMRKMPKSTMC